MTRISVIVATAGAALTLGVQAGFAQEIPATLGVSPEVARQLELAAFDERPATLAVSPEVARRIELANFDGRPATLAVSPEVARQIELPTLDSKGTGQPLPDPVASSGSNVEWSKVGIGLGIGILLAVGLFGAVRASRRPLAH